MAAVTDLSEWEKDPRLFLFTSLTAGSSHIITATSRIETILKANRIPFVAVDTATDEKARKLWGRRGAKRKLPGLVKEGYVIADLEEVEEWNEFGELEENIGPVPASTAPPGVNAVQTTLGNLRMQDAASAAAKPIAPTKASTTPAKPAAATKTTAAANSSAPVDSDTTPIATPLVGLVGSKPKPLSSISKSQAAKPETTTSTAEDKKESIEFTKEEAKESTATPEGHVKESTVTSEEQSLVKKESIDTANDETAPSSIAASSTISIATPSEPVIAAPIGGAAGETKHRGSSVSTVSPEEIKEVEQKIAIPEEHEATEAAPAPALAPASASAPASTPAPAADVAPAAAADKTEGGDD